MSPLIFSFTEWREVEVIIIIPKGVGGLAFLRRLLIHFRNGEHTIYKLKVAHRVYAYMVNEVALEDLKVLESLNRWYGDIVIKGDVISFEDLLEKCERLEVRVDGSEYAKVVYVNGKRILPIWRSGK